MRTIFWIFVGLVVLPVVGCLTCYAVLPKKSDPQIAKEANEDHERKAAPSPQRLLPETANGLTRLTAEEDHWPKVEDRHGIGTYAWSDDPSRKVARLSCNNTPDDIGTCDKGSRRITLGDRPACLYREDRGAKTFMDGAAVIWNDCALQFEPGGAKGHTERQIQDAALAIAAFVTAHR
jgi:hypothetical protein